METTLLIMAAGIGSRFGGGIKQLEPVDSRQLQSSEYDQSILCAVYRLFYFLLLNCHQR